MRQKKNFLSLLFFFSISFLFFLSPSFLHLKAQRINQNEIQNQKALLRRMKNIRSYSEFTGSEFRRLFQKASQSVEKSWNREILQQVGRLFQSFQETTGDINGFVLENFLNLFQTERNKERFILDVQSGMSGEQYKRNVKRIVNLLLRESREGNA